MIAIIFLGLLLAVIWAWIGARRPAIYSFAVTLLLAVIWFVHHLTTHLNIQL